MVVVIGSGYMPPEYAYHGQFLSLKSDVYSFGVLIMEIITGKKNTRLHDSENTELLLSYVSRNSILFLRLLLVKFFE